MCLLVGWEVPDLILLPAKQLAAVLRGGEGFPPRPLLPSGPLVWPWSQPRGALLSRSKQPGAILPCPGGVLVGFFPSRLPHASVSPGESRLS